MWIEMQSIKKLLHQAKQLPKYPSSLSTYQFARKIFDFDFLLLTFFLVNHIRFDYINRIE
jgi:hypothetical protein